MGWSMQYVKMTVAYDGTNYNGFQRQKNGVGVQQVLEKALSKTLHEEIKLVASGRTDAGVHAWGQVISFATNSTMPVVRIPLALGKRLPGDIVVLQVESVTEAFHARYGARSKTYKYRILLNEVADPFERNYAWEIKGVLDVEAMQIAANYLLGQHDFTSFRNMGSVLRSPVRTITKARWQRKSKKELIFTITGDGFLYRMVRNIVGCLVKVGKGELTPQEFQAILQARERKRAGMSAPPQGLYLYQVKY